MNGLKIGLIVTTVGSIVAGALLLGNSCRCNSSSRVNMHDNQNCDDQAHDENGSVNYDNAELIVKAEDEKLSLMNETLKHLLDCQAMQIQSITIKIEPVILG